MSEMVMYLSDMAGRRRNPGIYQVRNIVNGKVYIGSAVNLKQRIVDHIWNLERGLHPNRHFQSSWNKHGRNAFEFTVLENVPDERDLIAVEQRYLDSLRPFDPKIGYNISPTAGSTLGIPCSPEKAAKIGNANRGKKRTEEWKANAARILAERNKTPEHRLKVSKGLIHSGHRPPPEAVLKAAEVNRNRDRIPGEDQRRSDALKANLEHHKHLRALNEVRRGMTDEQVVEMQGLKRDGWKIKDLMQRYGVSKRTILVWSKRQVRIDQESIGQMPAPVPQPRTKPMQLSFEF